MITKDPETAIARMSDFEFSAFIKRHKVALVLIDKKLLKPSCSKYEKSGCNSYS